MALGNERRVVVTGVSRGLGRAAILGFARAGCKVAGCARSGEVLEGLDRELSIAASGSGFLTALDTTNKKAVADWSDKLLTDFGAPDLLVNNAAIIHPPQPLWELSAKEFDEVVDVNIKGVANVLRCFVPKMIASSRPGVIVNLSSTWGRTTASGFSAYCASKWAVEGMTGSLAQELPSGVIAVTLNPGVIDTAMLRVAFGEHASAYGSAESWAGRAVPRLLALTPSDNGARLEIPMS